MNNNNFLKGMDIFRKYLEPESYGIHAEHDQIWVCDENVVTEDEAIRLDALGWFISEDSWSCFT